MKVGIIGIGVMGYQIAKKFLTSGYDVGVFDIDDQATTKLAKFGSKTYPTPAQLAEEYQYIISILPNGNIVKSIVLGEAGLLAGFHDGSMLIDMTSSDPLITKDLAVIIGQKGYHMIDAPVSGGVRKAMDGTLTIIVGGERSSFLKIEPLLNTIGENIVHVGEIGAGHTMKALNNLISATTLAVTGEALALGIKQGLDPIKMLNVINSSTGRSLSSEQKFPEQIISRKFAGSFSLELMVKDLSIAMNMANREHVPAHISSASHQLWQQALAMGTPDHDHTTIVKLIEDMMKVEISKAD